MKIFSPAFTKILIVSCCLLPAIKTMEAQTPTDATMMHSGQVCLAVSYTNDSWDQYWEGTKLRTNGNIGTLTRHTIAPMFDLGIVKHINVMAALPYVITHPSAGQIQGDKGFPEFAMWVKGDLPEIKLGSGKLHLLVTLGGSVPVGNYAPDYAYPIGLGCAEASLRGIAHFQLKQGFYLRAQSGYHLRGISTLDREFYYSTEGYYTNQVDMPNAIDYSGTLGYITKNSAFKAELIYDGFSCLSGFDIRIQDAGFPSNKMILTRLGGDVKYFIPKVQGLGMEAYGGYVLSGRNVGQSLVLQGTVSYFFDLWKKKNNAADSQNQNKN